MRVHATKDFWLAALRADGPALRAAVGEIDPGTPVPSCPDWTISDLTRHVGSVVGYVGDVAANRRTDNPGPRQAPPTFGNWPETLDWFDRTWQQTLTRLDGLDPEQPAWNWAPQAKRAAFWHRRLAHEGLRDHGCQLGDSQIDAILMKDVELNAAGLAAWLQREGR